MRRKGIRSLLVVLIAVAGSIAGVNVTVTAPSIVFHRAPGVVVVEKDIQVVPDFDHEVFLFSGVYWTFWDGHWYRLPKWNGRWVRVAPGAVPSRIVAIPRGKYIRYRQVQRKAAKAHRKKEKRHAGHPGKGRRK